MSPRGAIVVGAGIFGCTVARALQLHGLKVTVFDDGRPMSGSRPSACLMKPSWFSGMAKSASDAGLAMLDEIYGLQEVELQVWPTRISAKAFWVPRMKILSTMDLEVKVVKVSKVSSGSVSTRNGWLDRDSPNEYLADLVVVCAGYWCSELIVAEGVFGRTGVSFKRDGQLLHGLVKPWAPYKQIVAFNDSENTVWAGDGSAIKPENWTRENEQRSYDRILKHVPEFRHHAGGTVGIRPMWKGSDPCLLRERSPGLWLCTGGGKNGTIAAGWAASELVRRVL